ncbi:unnamed protein product, partial [Sphagnum balticum]
MANTKQLPAGLRLLKRLRGKDLNFNAYRTSVLIITFISYAFYHMSRKPPSIAKTVLDPEDNMQSAATLQGRGWPPFDGKTASGRLVVEDVGRTVDPNVTLKDTANGLPQNDLEEGHQDNQKEEEWLLDVKKAEKKQAAPLSSEMEPAIGFFEAWRIPGVATFAFCLFFSKLVAYTFLYWLPFYIRHT